MSSSKALSEDQISALNSWLSLPQSSESAANFDPLTFLQHHFHSIPPHLITFFSPVVSPRERALLVPTIRKRRIQFGNSAEGTKYLSWQQARIRNPELFARIIPAAIANNSVNPLQRDEQSFAEERDFFDGPDSFLARTIPKSMPKSQKRSLMNGRGQVGLIGKLGRLLADEEDSRKRADERGIASRIRREQGRVEEVESESESDAEDSEDQRLPEEEILRMSKQDQAANHYREFEQLIRELWIDGRSVDSQEMFDIVDWDEEWDRPRQGDDGDDGWFDDE